jgi:hypothetical protein
MVDEAERLIRNESPQVFDEVEAEWDNETLRQEVAAVNGVLAAPTPDASLGPAQE